MFTTTIATFVMCVLSFGDELCCGGGAEREGPTHNCTTGPKFKLSAQPNDFGVFLDCWTAIEVNLYKGCN